MLERRTFLKAAVGTAGAAFIGPAGRAYSAAENVPSVSLDEVQPGEDIFAHLQRTRGGFDATRYKQILGAANPFKEGDQIVGVAAANDTSRATARTLLAATRIEQIEAHPLLEDDLYRLLKNNIDRAAAAKTQRLTLGELKQFLLREDEPAIQAIMPGLSSDSIGCVVKLLSDEELIAIGQKIFNPLPGSNIGAKGYLGARIQPNSPTDNVSDIQWQVFDGWSY